MTWIALKSTCPPSCICKSEKVKTWHHAQCSTQSYIDEFGDLSCAKGCCIYFIQHAFFKCEKSHQYEQYKNATQFLISLAQAMQSAEFQLNDQEKIQFITTLNLKVVQRWIY